MRGLRERRSELLLLGATLVVCIALVEGFLALLVSVPAVTARLPAVFRKSAQTAYSTTRNIIQFEPACARYSPFLTYTLRPGTCTFSNAEFETRYQVNSRGYRSSEESLRGARIVVIGDSFAMGWGVEQDETYAALLEKTTGMPVLDTAVASYGTVRELRTLETVDTSAAQWLVIHYTSGDFAENRYFEEHGTLDILDEQKYDATRDAYLRDKAYWPGKYTRLVVYTALRSIWQKAASATSDPTSDRDAAHAFLFVLSRAKNVDLEHVRIVVLYHEGGHFVDEVRSQLRAGTSSAPPLYPPSVGNLILLDLTAELADSYFLLDDHLRREGHQIIAARLAALVSR